MNSRLASLISFGAIVIVIIMGAGLFYTMSKKDHTMDADSVLGQKEVTVADVQKHTSASDCWVYIGGQVFDATTIITQNPDKTIVLTAVCGGDGSKVYTIQKYSDQPLDKQTITKLRDQLTTYQIGYLSL